MRVERAAHTHTPFCSSILTYRHTCTHIPSYGIVEDLWQHKVLPVYEEVLYQHPQGEEQVEGPKDVANNCKPIRKGWNECPYCFIKGHIGTVKERGDSERKSS